MSKRIAVCLRGGDTITIYGRTETVDHTTLTPCGDIRIITDHTPEDNAWVVPSEERIEVHNR